MKYLFSLFLCLGNLYTHAQTDAFTSFKIHSELLHEDRTCLVQLPENYSEAGNKSQSYPIIILLDGATFFQSTGGVIRFLSSPRNGNFFMPESILIAIENVDRRRDFTVTKIVTKRGNTSGGGRQFLDFIEKELLPYIDTNFRTEKHRTLIGHSLGGLLALNSYMDKNSAFNAFLSIDPSIWWNTEQMEEKVEDTHASSFSKRLYLATANQGKEKYERNKKRHDRLYELLIAKSSQKDFIQIKYYENEDHRSVPLKAIYDGLKFSFSDY